MAASRGEQNAVLLQYGEKVRDVKRSVRRDKRGRGT